MQIVAAAPEGVEVIPAFVRAMAREMKARGIESQDSDAFDASRVVILTDAASAIGYEWDEDPSEADTIRIWPMGTSVDWDSVGGAS